MLKAPKINPNTWIPIVLIIIVMTGVTILNQKPTPEITVDTNGIEYISSSNGMSLRYCRVDTKDIGVYVTEDGVRTCVRYPNR